MLSDFGSWIAPVYFVAGTHYCVRVNDWITDRQQAIIFWYLFVFTRYCHFVLFFVSPLLIV